MSKFYIVSQNQTKKFESERQIMWSPKLDSNNKHYGPYTLMGDVQKGDIVFHVYKKVIYAVSRVIVGSHSAPKPSAFSNQTWNDDGWEVNCRMHEIQIPFSSLNDSQMNQLSSIFAKNGTYKQRYLMQLSQTQGEMLLKLITEKSENILIDLLSAETDTHVVSKLVLEMNSGRNLRETESYYALTNSKKVFHDNNEVNKQVGLSGEESVLKYLRENEKYAGYQIKPISSNLDGSSGNDSAGYDIELVHEKSGHKIYIEVKTTTGKDSPFFMSANEVAKMKLTKNSDVEDYQIFRVFELDAVALRPARLRIIKDDDLNNLKFDAINYRVSL